MLLGKRTNIPRKSNSTRQSIKPQQLLKPKSVIRPPGICFASFPGFPCAFALSAASCLPLCLDVARYAFDKRRQPILKCRFCGSGSIVQPFRRFRLVTSAPINFMRLPSVKTAVCRLSCRARPCHAGLFGTPFVGKNSSLAYRVFRSRRALCASRSRMCAGSFCRGVRARAF